MQQATLYLQKAIQKMKKSYFLTFKRKEFLTLTGAMLA